MPEHGVVATLVPEHGVFMRLPADLVLDVVLGGFNGILVLNEMGTAGVFTSLSSLT